MDRESMTYKKEEVIQNRVLEEFKAKKETDPRILGVGLGPP